MILTPPPEELRQLALQALMEPDTYKKVHLASGLQAQAATVLIANHVNLPAPPNLPGCPARPELRSHLDLPKRSPFTQEGLAALLHAVTHIEFNAINLALDAIWRFRDMPRAYYLDWLKVAAEEARHFSLLRAQLQSMGYDYGDFPAHTGLWDMAKRTEADLLARMALVPRTLEARGLDATPPMQAKLRRVGTPEALRAVDILDVILHDEIGHVAIGNHWYRHLCAQHGLDPVAAYAELAKRYDAPRLKGPLNLNARRAAGFDDAELALLNASRQ
ncbi:MAG: ferritin-like domain-containing protein [Polaromonas sp.]|uniref:ferritin-like domain-containing protein n=1 Tax=Polaromonas sp. TaxID=1869339 RepID=UPI0017B43483|nr:ferritin-like domain-containing protein [Polaromonas sp.]NMM09976.1 ferritin-like domain-containing protein [Polaromonas sp.]